MRRLVSSLLLAGCLFFGLVASSQAYLHFANAYFVWESNTSNWYKFFNSPSPGNHGTDAGCVYGGTSPYQPIGNGDAGCWYRNSDTQITFRTARAYYRIFDTPIWIFEGAVGGSDTCMATLGNATDKYTGADRGSFWFVNPPNCS